MQFNAIVSAILARHVSVGGARIDALQISTARWPERALADAWLRFATAHVAGSFTLVMAPPVAPPPNPGPLLLGELPRRPNAAAIRLSLEQATLQLPAMAVFCDLAKLSLVNVAFARSQGIVVLPAAP